MHYRTYMPPMVLRPYIRYFWSYDARQHHIPALYIKSFADQYPRLIFQDLEHYAPIRNVAGAALPWCYLSGIDTRHTEAVLAGAWSHFGVSFYPHGLHAIFGVSAQELINEMPDIGEFCSAALAQQMQQAGSHARRVQLISEYLYHKLQERKQPEFLISHIIQSHQVTDATRITALPRQFNISERQLERRFKTSVGISLKKFQRIVRFQKALQLLGSADYSQLTSIAYQLSYTDQSHFIKDFRAFSGLTPYEFVKNKHLGSESASFIYTPDPIS